VSVAATKTFVCQVAVMFLLALRLAELRGTLDRARRTELVTDLRRVPHCIQELVGSIGPRIDAVAERVWDKDFFLYLGRHVGLPVALEGALKLKELSYIHAEGFPAAELKHGPIALIEPGVPVVAIAPECHIYPKMLSNIQEVRARGAEVIAVVTEGDTQIHALADHVLEVPATPELLSPVVVTVPLQLFAYHVAKLRGCDVDQPRNLAKSVTVE
jgi:glutamine---fructose-6-phosphate transaminase (isomerizing)